MTSSQKKLSKIRRPRVHITYDLQIGDQREYRELPFVVAVLSDLFGHNKKNTPLKERNFTKITKENVAIADATDGEVITPGEAGAGGYCVYSTLVLGENAYGVTEVTGGGLQHIVKQLGSSGTADPLNQRATVGWKAIKVAEILVDAFMVRVESSSTFAAKTATGN